MGAPILVRRLARGAAYTALLATTVAGSCEPTGPGTFRIGPLRILPVLESAVDAALLGLDGIAVTIRRVDDGTLVADTLLAFDADADAVLAWILEMENLPTMVRVAVEVRRGATPMFAGTLEVEVVEAPASGTGEAHNAPLGFVGPGADVTTLVVTPGSTLLTFGEEVQYAVTATDQNGREVSDVVLVWTSSDPGLAPIDASAVLRAPTARGTVEVTAQIPTGVSGSATARFQPAASRLEILAGDGARAPVGQPVILEVRVIGADGQGVEGATVTFGAPAAATVRDPAQVSDADGRAATEGTLGTTARSYAFTAEIAGVAPVTLTATADPGPAAALAFGAEPTSVGANEILPAVTVEVRDAFGNLVSDPVTVSLSFGANPGGGSLSGTTQATSGGGVATFTSLSIDAPGSGYTLVATADQLPAATSDPFDVRQIPQSVTVTPGQAQLEALDATVVLTAAAFDNMNNPIAGQPFTWTTSNAAVATVDAGGMVTAVGNGTATVTATAGAASAAATITVQQQPALVLVTPETLTLDALGEQRQVTAIVADANGFAVTGQTVTWGTSAAAVATVNDAGLVTAVGNGSATIHATAGSLVGEARVTVRQAIVSISVEPGMVTFDALQQQRPLTAVARDANGQVVNDVTFAWETDDAGVASVDATGTVSATGNGTATISAVADQAVGTAAVTVAQVATSLAITPQQSTLAAFDATVALTATAFDANGFAVPGVSPAWNSLAPTIATVDQLGIVTAVANGAAQIEATANGLADRAAVTVRQTVAAVTVSPAAVSFAALADVAQLTAEARDANDFIVADAEFTWASDAAAVADVDQAGAVTATGNGQAIVTATSGATVGAATVSVAQVGTSIAVTPANPTLTALAAQIALTAIVRDANGFAVAGAEPAWRSLVPEVAGVDLFGTVTAVANGQTPVVAAFEQLADTTTVTVQQEVADVQVTPGTVLLEAFDAQASLSAEARDANGFIVADASPTWSTDDPAVADVDAGGVVTAVGNGATSARARVGAIEGFATVQVRQRVTNLALTIACPVEAATHPAGTSGNAAAVEARCDTLTAFGDQALVEADARDANGHPVTDPAIVWMSLAPEIAAVDFSGLVTAGGNGAAIIRGEAGDAAAEVEIVVRQIVATLVVEPPSLTLAVGEQHHVMATAFDRNGFVVADALVTWASRLPHLADVDQNGVVTALQAGVVSIDAAAGTIREAAVVTIE